MYQHVDLRFLVDFGSQIEVCRTIGGHLPQHMVFVGTVSTYLLCFRLMSLHYPKHFLVLFSKVCILKADIYNTEGSLILLD